MSFKFHGIQVSVSYPFCAVLALFFTLDQTGLAGQMLAAALFHEMGHLLAMYGFGQSPHSIDFASFGIRIQKEQTTRLSYARELWIYLAGPLMNLSAAGMLLLLGPRWEQLSQVHLSLGLFNLLPIGALDGGRIVELLTDWCFPLGKGELFSKALSLCCLLPLILVSILSFFQGKWNLTLFITAFYLGITLLRRP